MKLTPRRNSRGFYLEVNMLPYQLSLKEVIEKAREYYDKGLLTAQHPNPQCRQCINKYEEYRCAVAACYPEEVLEHSFGSVESGVEDGYLLPPSDPLEWAIIVRLQQTHDYWADCAKQFPGHEITKQHEQSFKYRIETSGTKVY